MTDIGIIFNKKLFYPEFPYNPDQVYPEIRYKYDPQPKNLIYKEIRNLFYKMGYDKENFNTKNWNPLSFLIKKGDNVLIKPNFVQDNDKYPFCVITHPSIIRVITDYAYIATSESGEVIIGDAPQMDTNLDNIKKYTKIDKLIDFYNQKKINIKFLDFRPVTVESKHGIWSKRIISQNKKKDNIIIDLKEKSLLYDLEKDQNKNFYGADYNRKIVNYHHNIYRNDYCISKTFLNADVVINIPKLKTHKKAGVTLNFKNLLGINIDKNFLPHYRIGHKNQKGDSFPYMNSFLNKMRFLRYIFRDLFLIKYNSRIARFFFKLVSLRRYIEYMIVKTFFNKFYSHYFLMTDGDWSGNDTIWRTILDLNIISLYSDKNGEMKENIQRKFYSIIDGVIGGEKDGPLNPNPRKAGTIIMGGDLFLIDLIATKMMGFDYNKIPLLKNTFLLTKYPIFFNKNLNEIRIISTNKSLNNIDYANLNINLNFIPATGWSQLNIKKEMKR